MIIKKVLEISKNNELSNIVLELKNICDFKVTKNYLILMNNFLGAFFDNYEEFFIFDDLFLKSMNKFRI